MKTADEILKGAPVRFAPNGKAFYGLTESDITTIQEEAYKAGLLVSKEIADNYVNSFATNSEAQNICGLIRDEITSHSKLNITENPPF